MNCEVALGRLEALLGRLEAVLPDLPGFRALELFGSLAERRADEYSDIDLVVSTDQPALARSEVLGLLESIGPVEFCWAISLRPGEWNPTVAFRDEGYYHKLDLSIVDAATDGSVVRDQTVFLLETDPKPSPPRLPASPAYAPEAGSVGHFLLNMLLGGTRYLKARKRGRVMTCYRFTSAAADWCASALYSRLAGKGLLGRKLNTLEYAELDALAPDAERRAFLDTLSYSSPATMDRAMLSLLTHIADHARALAGIVDEVIPDAVVDRFLGFVSEELCCGVQREVP